jgi:hypothetical protein
MKIKSNFFDQEGRPIRTRKVVTLPHNEDDIYNKIINKIIK